MAGLALLCRPDSLVTDPASGMLCGTPGQVTNLNPAAERPRVTAFIDAVLSSAVAR